LFARNDRLSALLVFGIATSLLLVPATAGAAKYPIPDYPFSTPVFGLATAPDNSLLLADAGSGIVELRKGVGSPVAALPGVSDVAPLGRGSMFAITGGPDGMLYRVSRGNTRPIANLGAFEAAVNPDGGEIDSNAFDVAALSGGQALVADAGGNSILVAGEDGSVDWVATLPDELASTANAKQLAGCPTPPSTELEFICGLPEAIPAQAVPTGVAIGPDGAYYVSELKGFPFPLDMSKVWRIEPGTRHAQCGSDPRCSVVADGFTSIVDLNFGPDGTLYVVEMDEASALAVELGAFGIPGLMQGGTVNACELGGSCSVVAGGLTIPLAVAADKTGQVYAAIAALIPGAAQVITLP
jgi:hypothetical protein